MADVKMGDKVRCKLSGFEGTADGRAVYLNGCVQFRVTSKDLKDGEPIREWFDEDDLEVVKAAKAPAAKPSGGPALTPPPRKYPDGR